MAAIPSTRIIDPISGKLLVVCAYYTHAKTFSVKKVWPSKIESYLKVT